jgi:dihydroxyacetone kinase
MELGLGIHGEPGASTAALQSAEAIVAQVRIVTYCDLL